MHREEQVWDGVLLELDEEEISVSRLSQIPGNLRYSSFRVLERYGPHGNRRCRYGCAALQLYVTAEMFPPG